MTQGGQLLNANQLVVSNPNLVQQLASGKATLTTINGQQVLIRTATAPNSTLAPATPVQVQGASNVVLKTQPTGTAQAVKVVKSPQTSGVVKVQSPVKTAAVSSTAATSTAVAQVKRNNN